MPEGSGEETGSLDYPGEGLHALNEEGIIERSQESQNHSEIPNDGRPSMVEPEYHEPFMTGEDVSTFPPNQAWQNPLDNFMASADEVSTLEQLLVPDMMSGISDWSWVYEDTFFDSLPDLNVPFQETAPLRIPVLYPDGSAILQDHSSIPQNDAETSPPIHIHPESRHIAVMPRSSPGSSAITESTENYLQRDVIESHIEYAVANVNSPESSESTAHRIWARREGSRKVQDAFRLDALRSVSHDSRNALDRFVSLFFENFHPLCPIFWEQGFESYQVSPIVFLSIVSIGARYAGEKAAQYGAMLHGRMRSLLVAMMPPKVNQQHASITFGLLITAAEIYLGKEEDFSQAQQLLAVLASQARRSGLFKAENYGPKDPHPEAKDADAGLAKWADGETKKRIVFEIFRLEAYLSSFTNTKPSVSWKELHIELPCSAYLWNLSGHDWKRRTLEAIEQSRGNGCRGFSDLVYGFLDGQENLQSLNDEDHERLFFAIQENLWSFCEDPDFLIRLGVDDFSASGLFDGEERHDSFNDGKALSTMPNLECKFKQAISGLRRWAEALSLLHQQSNPPGQHQSHLRGQIRLHTTLLRFNAPIDLLSEVSSDTEAQQYFPRILIWTNTTKAEAAIRHSHEILSLLKNGTEQTRNSFDISYLIAIHHAALVVWVCAGVSADGMDAQPHPPFEGHSLSREDSRDILLGLKKLLYDISPSWLGPTVFGSVIDSLIARDFPAIHDT
ncbi:hypothetical protein V500_04897 [Pseudogymnoascus sp. VKM F-4518 (FW-2643)]|nr:hypothetical protein V500_04897 [Pseudogymnoascus sp. VKM F-4518 (FW-2643)]